jgi:radical SAM superfamily enzyme YgiQ (UPF0313 family)
LKIAPEHTESGPLTKMMKPGIGSYDKFKSMFDKFSAEAGKKQFLVPYFIAAHPGTTKNPLRKITRDSEKVDVVKGEKRRRLHKAFLRYHDAKHWPLLRDALKAMGRADLIGNGKHHLIPTWQPLSDDYQSARRKNSTPSESASPKKGSMLTQHTGLPPRKRS